MLNNLATTLAVEPVFSSSSGDAASDVNGWLGTVLADSNISPQAAALRTSLQATLGSNVPLREADLFAFYQRLLTASSPLNIWPGVTQWCRADVATATTFSDQGTSGLDYTGACTVTATDATLNNLQTIGLNGTLTMASSLSLPAAPVTVLAVVKLGTFAGSTGFIIDGPNSLHTCAIAAFNSTQVAFANAPTVLVNSAYSAWQLLRGDFSRGVAGAADIVSAGVTQRFPIGAGAHAPDPGRVIGATNTQQSQWWELIHLTGVPSKWDMALYRNYLDVTTNFGVLHT